MMRALLNVDDYRRRAKTRLPRGLFEFVAGGAEDQLGLEALRRALETLRFLPPALIDVSGRSPDTELFGESEPARLSSRPPGSRGRCGATARSR
jgi:(S)-mandelate dehydrogenase